MKKPIQITIPTPCHENWQQMTPVDKGRFCASCQKNVIDFTNSSDREIAAVLKNSENSCGRFKVNQLNRDLIVPKEKSTLWIAASAAVISFLTIGTNRLLAQEPVATEQEPVQQKPYVTGKSTTTLITIKGIVLDSNKMSIPGVNILNMKTGAEIQSDFDGLFSIEARKGDMLEISFLNMIGQEIIIRDDSNLEIILIDEENLEPIYVGGVTPMKQRTFFGRVFHTIGNIFR
ncbi:hypothetical protein D3C87_263200 [compost metagenome]